MPETQSLESLFSIFNSAIFKSYRESVKYSTAANEINAMFGNVLLPLGFVPFESHSVVTFVVTSSQRRKFVADRSQEVWIRTLESA